MPKYDPNIILVVDDDQEIVQTMTAVLEGHLPNAKFLAAYNGNKAIDEFEKADPMPGIVILDLMLPGKSGFLVLERIKNRGNRGKHRVPIIIMISGNPGKRHQMYAESLGVMSYLVKPFDITDDLLPLVKKAQEILTPPPPAAA